MAVRQTSSVGFECAGDGLGLHPGRVRPMCTDRTDRLQTRTRHHQPRISEQ
jgi:hypothetical protein